MKKIFLAMLIVAVSVFGQKASAQINTDPNTATDAHRYYYFPNSNVYYDPDAKFYWYYDGSVTKWIKGQNLPSTVVVTKTPRYIVRYKGDDPWKNNDEDMKKFKVKKNGDVKVKVKD